MDPFNITTFTWLQARLILVIAKSRYVCQWPWHDFLWGQVICESIKEIAEVTDIDAQMISTNFTHNERYPTRIHKGPCNGIFGRRAGSRNEGFSIDVPIRLTTMLASGIPILKVLSRKGERLICLDVRKGSDWDIGAAIRHHYVEYLTCTDLEEEDEVKIESLEGTNGAMGKKILRLTRLHFMWTRVLGV